MHSQSDRAFLCGNDDLLALIRAHQRGRGFFEAIYNGAGATLAVQHKSGRVCGSLNIRGAAVVLRPAKGSRGGALVLIGLSEADATARAARANEGKGLDRHSPN